MSRNPRETLSDEDLTQIAIEFESREFSAEELAAIAATRRPTPRAEPAINAADEPRLQNDQGELSL